MKTIKVGTKPKAAFVGRYTCNGCGTVVELEDTADDRARITGKVTMWVFLIGVRMECSVCGCERAWGKTTPVTAYST